MMQQMQQSGKTTIQVETLRRFRNGGSQFMRVEHVHVNGGGQAVLGAPPSTADPNQRRRFAMKTAGTESQILVRAKALREPLC
jgi:hypothetical protein